MEVVRKGKANGMTLMEIMVNGGHGVFDLKPDSTSLIVYGNFAGSSASFQS